MGMENKRNRKKAAYILLCIGILIAAFLVLSHNHEAKLNSIAERIQQNCKFVLSVEYSNSPEYPQAQQKLAEAQNLLNSHRFRDKSVALFVTRAQTHFDALVENPFLDYDAAELEALIQDTLEKAPGNWSVYLEIPNTNFKIEINNRTVSAASTIKLFNMVTFYDELKNGKLMMTEERALQMYAMITESSNSDSNAIVTAIGGGNFFAGAEKVTAFAHKIGADNTQEEHMLYDVATLTPGQNTTSVRDCGTVLRLLYNGKCVSPEYDRTMLGILKQQTRRFKLPLYLPEDTVIAHKTGERSTSELDVGIIYSPNCNYILCISVTDFNGLPVRETFGRVSEIIYNYFNE